MHLGKLAKQDFVAVEASDDATLARSIMAEEGLDVLPVTDNGVVVGGVSRIVLRNAVGPVGIYMQPAVLIPEDEDVVEAARQMIDHRAVCLVVTHNGEPTHVLS